MRGINVVLAGLTAAALLAASVSSADARWFGHRGRGPGLGLLGGVVVGAATIATLPFALLAGAANSGPPSRGGYYDQGDNGYGPPQGGYGYGPPQGAYGYGAYPPPPRYARPYGPPPGYYRYGYGY
jgi:hypothetical protein